MAVTLNASTTAGLELTPDTSGVLNIQSGGSTKIAVTSAGVAVTGLAKASLPTGSVLQVVSYTPTSGQGTTTSTSFVASSLALSITPTSATSKIYVQANFPCYTGSTNLGYFTIYRGATNLGGSVGGFGGVYTSNQYTTTGLNYLDSPATTSSTTYTLYIRATSGSFSIGDNSLASSITLMEIAA